MTTGQDGDEPPFYFVWREGGEVPRFKHETATQAENEAERLARENPGHTFYVLTPTACTVERRVTIIRFDPLANEIPF